MTLSATGPIMSALALARTALSNSSTFQAWVGAEDATEALENIFLFSPGDDDPPDRFVIISWGDESARWQMENTSEFTPKASGSIHVQFEGDVGEDYQDDPEQAALEFGNALGGILWDLAVYEAASDANQLFIARVGLDYGPWRIGKKQGEPGKDKYVAGVIADWE